jgi:glycolate oxidase
MTKDSLLAELRSIVGAANARVDTTETACYAYDATHYTHHPDVVLYPATTAEVSAILTAANRERVPVIARGAGTSITGGAVPIHGGIVICSGRMNRIVEIDTENLTATVEPGVVLATFQAAVEKLGLFYPPDPASLSVSTLGGNVGENAGGPRGVKYGSTKDYVLGLEIVLADGTVMRTGAKTVKSSSGYDLTHLFVGSEGTLGVITQITVRLLPLPEAKRTVMAIFDSVEAAAKTVSATIAAKVVPTTLELMDDVVIDRVEAYRPCGLPRDAAAVLLAEVDGSQQGVARQVELVAEVARNGGAREVRVASTTAEADTLWAARRGAFAAMARSRPTIIVEDATVPRDRIPETVARIKELCLKHDLQIGILAHAGDGNMHPLIMTDLRDREEMARVARFVEDLFQTTLAMGGTLSGEHGIGHLKKRYMEWQHGSVGVEMMRRMKQAFDPNNILNPGKLLPDQGEAASDASSLLD